MIIPQKLTLAILIMVRLLVFCLGSPWQILQKIPAPARFFLLLICSVSLALSLKNGNSPTKMGEFIPAVFAEITNGGLLALISYCAFLPFSLAGQIIDVQLGFNMASIYNGLSQLNVSVFGQLLHLFPLMIFFTTSIHLKVLEVFAETFVQLPPGHFLPHMGREKIFHYLTHSYYQGLMIILAFIAFLLLIETLAYITVYGANNALNFWLQPAKLLLGIALALELLLNSPSLIQQLFAEFFSHWQEYFL